MKVTYLSSPQANSSSARASSRPRSQGGQSTTSTTRCVQLAPSGPRRQLDSLTPQALKKIINSLAAGRPATEAAILATGGRLTKRQSTSDGLLLASPATSAVETPTFGAIDPAPISVSVSAVNGDTVTAEPEGDALLDGDLEPLPAEAQPPAPGQTQSRFSAGNRNGNADRGASAKAHRDAFFFLLQRELEKVSQPTPSFAQLTSDQPVLPYQGEGATPPPPVAAQ